MNAEQIFETLLDARAPTVTVSTFANVLFPHDLVARDRWLYTYFREENTRRKERF